ncbi:MAG: acylphosphatase [Myxococcota bacterium]
MSKERASLRIKGRVQGVWYRESAKEEALRLSLTGWVRNVENGEVEALAEGKREDLEVFIAWCHQGPPAAHVSEVHASFAPATGEFPTFVVMRR